MTVENYCFFCKTTFLNNTERRAVSLEGLMLLKSKALLSLLC